jgi:hypothetical protein
MNSYREIKDTVVKYVKDISADTIGWLAVMFIHCATIPPLVGLLTGVSDHLPSIDVVAFLWFGLLLLYIKALVTRDTLITTTISLGFVIQAALLGFLVFK